jgi:hypothetical protein
MIEARTFAHHRLDELRIDLGRRFPDQGDNAFVQTLLSYCAVLIDSTPEDVSAAMVANLNTLLANGSGSWRMVRTS